MGADKVGETRKQGILDQLEDEKIVMLCKERLPYNASGFEALLRRYEPVVYRSCLRYLHQPSDAKEVYQDTFIRVFHALPKFEGRSSFKTWLFRITANVCATYFAKRQREAKNKHAYEQEQQVQYADQHTLTTQSEINKDVIMQAIEKLPENDKLVIVLRYVSGLPLKEIASIVEHKLSAAKMRLYPH